jgi:hypothetical protein
MSILGSVAGMKTAEEFEAQYAAASGVTITELHAFGRYAEPCNCKDNDACEGWAMGHPWEDAITEDWFRGAAT